jgi:isoaspartyl peptidase/L-asparaginase-like protein (Ntn-hydrolase superfamily)
MRAVLVHGGAGAPAERIDGCERAAAEAMELLESGGSALDAVEAAAVVMEDDPAYNAGTGSRPRMDGVCEMDAAVMCSDGGIGIVTLLRRVRNPVRVARLVMERTPHVALGGAGALGFARRMGFGDYDPLTERRRERLEKALGLLREGRRGDPRLLELTGPGDTIGAVALDARGGMAVANSTGGVELMLPGRIGDSPMPGAGFYCGPAGAVATTGDGESIIGRMSAIRVYRMLEEGADPAEACRAETDAYPSDVVFGVIALTPGATGTANNRTMPVASLTGE